MRSISLLILAFFAINSCLHAVRLTVVNETGNIIQVMVIPHGIMQLSKHKKAKALKKRYAQIKPGYRARLKSDDLESINVKVLSKSQKSMNWYEYDNMHSHQLISAIKSNEEEAKIYIMGAGDQYKAKIGQQIIEGKNNQISRIFR